MRDTLHTLALKARISTSGEVNKMTEVEQRYWSDLNWAREHHTQLLQHYEDEWVAIYNMQVIAHGPDGARVEKLARQKLGNKRFPVYFVDSASNIYAHQSLLHCN